MRSQFLCKFWAGLPESIFKVLLYKLIEFNIELVVFSDQVNGG